MSTGRCHDGRRRKFLVLDPGVLSKGTKGVLGYQVPGSTSESDSSYGAFRPRMKGVYRKPDVTHTITDHRHLGDSNIQYSLYNNVVERDLLRFDVAPPPLQPNRLRKPGYGRRKLEHFEILKKQPMRELQVWGVNNVRSPKRKEKLSFDHLPSSSIDRSSRVSSRFRRGWVRRNGFRESVRMFFYLFDLPLGFLPCL